MGYKVRAAAALERYCGPAHGTWMRGSVVTMSGSHYIAARVIFKIVYGEEPHEVDHRDLNPANDRLDNLRAADHYDNMQNRKMYKGNACGFKGVTKTPNGRYAACIMANYSKKYLGTFDTPEEAHAAYRSAALELHGEFSRGS